MKVEFFRHNIGQKEIEEIVKVLNSIFITTGKVVEEFEKKFSDYLEGGHSVGVTSCTAALHLALVALGIKPGEEVITTPLTFVSTASSILFSGGKPVFVDVEEGTGLLDLHNIEKAITDKTFAISPVHLYGQMVDMRALRKLADKYGLYIIEDCAHCIEGIRDEVRPGGLGDIACFSFYATKNITSAEGGALFTKDESLVPKLKKLRLHGMTASAEDRYTKGYKHYDVEMLGYKYNMANINAALLLNQVERIDYFLKKREEICLEYDRAFLKSSQITVPKILPNIKSARHLYTILVDPEKRDRILVELQEKGVGVAVNFRPVHLMEYYRKRFGFKEGDFKIAEGIGNSTISLPLYPLLKEEEIEYVIEKVKEVVCR